MRYFKTILLAIAFAFASTSLASEGETHEFTNFNQVKALADIHVIAWSASPEVLHYSSLSEGMYFTTGQPNIEVFDDEADFKDRLQELADELKIELDLQEEEPEEE